MIESSFIGITVGARQKSSTAHAGSNMTPYSPKRDKIDNNFDGIKDPSNLKSYNANGSTKGVVVPALCSKTIQLLLPLL